MNTRRFSAGFSAVALAAALSINWLVMPAIVEAAPLSQRAVESVPAAPNSAGVVTSPEASIVSGSDILREQHLGRPQIEGIPSTSDVLRDRELGGVLTVARASSEVLHDERPGPTGHLSGR